MIRSEGTTNKFYSLPFSVSLCGFCLPDGDFPLSLNITSPTLRVGLGSFYLFWQDGISESRSQPCGAVNILMQC